MKTKLISKFTILHLFFAAGILVFSGAPSAYAQNSNTQGKYVGRGVQASIEALLCTPTLGNATVSNVNSSVPGVNSTATVTNNPASNDLANCINKGYKFALAFGAVAAVFFVVLAGYMYMVGGEKGKTEAKSIIVAVLVGFLIMLSSYVLLKQINPTLTAFRTIQPPQLMGNYAKLSCDQVNIGKDCVGEGSEEGTDDTGNNDGGGVGGAPTPGTYSDAEAKALLKGAGIDIQSAGVRFDNVQKRVIEELLAVKKACNCSMAVGSGTDGQHAAGVCSHKNGYKVDLNYSYSQALNSYIMTNFPNVGTRGDGAIKYRNNSSGAVWNKEPRNGKIHWDVQTKCP